jgi:hypothetical protein
MNVEPDRHWQWFLVRGRASLERKKLTAESEGLQGPKRADKARSAVLTSGGRRPERAEMLYDPWRGLVQYQPVEPELLDGPDELLEIYRLADVAVGAEAVAVEDVPLLSGRSQDDHG